MSMSQSLYTGWTGLAAHQRCLDNTGNNIANVNTVGYKKNDFMFSNLLNKAITGGGLPSDGNRGSTNPMGLGVGVTTGAIATNQRQGPIEQTGNPLNAAIDGNGYFIVNSGYGTALTRSGDFYLDSAVSASQRNLLVGDGMKVQGWMAENGVVTPSQTVTDILLPAQGDLLPGEKTTDIELTGVLPTNVSGADFNGNATRNLELKGNLSTDNNTLETRIHVPVTQTGGDDDFSRQIQEVPVRITFSGPTLSADGTTNNWSWTMHTVDWPNAGDPEVQIYPTPGDPNFTQGQVGFFAESDPARRRAEGQAAASTVSPGSSSASTTITDESGREITTYFNVSSDFRLDVSRLTTLDDAPGGNPLDTWNTDGNPQGTMRRAVTVFDEYTAFENVVDENGISSMQAVRRVQERQNTICFRRESQDDAGTTWSYKSSVDDQEGTLRFNTLGELADSTGDTQPIDYDFSELRNINSASILQIADQDGFPDGTLESLGIGPNGMIFGNYSNGINEPLAQLAMGTVPNTSGLSGSSGTIFYTSPSSGDIVVGTAGDAESGGTADLPAIGAGSLVSNALESSNVDLTIEFTTLITTQRGYQGSARIVQTSDEMLQTLLGVKR